MKHEKGTFERSTIELDGNEYVGCNFISCTFVYAGMTGIAMVGNNISDDCNFEFVGAAGSTINALRGIWSLGPFGRATVLATFQSIAPDLKNLH